MNAQTGKNENNKIGFHDQSNRNGEYQTDFSLEKSFMLKH